MVSEKEMGQSMNQQVLEIFFQVTSDIYSFIILEDVQFKALMATLKAKQKDLKAKGFGNKPRDSNHR